MNTHKVYKNIRARFPALRAVHALQFARECSPTSVTGGQKVFIEFQIPSEPYPRTFGAKPREYSHCVSVWNSLHTHRSGRRVRWCEDTARAGLRFVGFADEILPRLRHNGWYTNDENYSGEVLRGAVWQLPGRKKTARFLSGYVDPHNNSAALIECDVIEEPSETYTTVRECDGARDAARYADSLAELYAELEREHNRHWQASRDIEEKRERIVELRAEHSLNAREYTEARGRAARALWHENLRIREEVSGLVKEIRELLDLLPDGKLAD